MFNILLKQSGDEGFEFEPDLLKSVKTYIREKEKLSNNKQSLDQHHFQSLFTP